MNKRGRKRKERYKFNRITGDVNAFFEISGEEPRWPIPDVFAWPKEKFASTRGRMFNFYSTYLEADDLKNDLIICLQTNCEKSEATQLIKILNNAKQLAPIFTAGKLARAINRGMPIMREDIPEIYSKKDGKTIDDLHFIIHNIKQNTNLLLKTKEKLKEESFITTSTAEENEE
jgi:hypothetical protein